MRLSLSDLLQRVSPSSPLCSRCGERLARERALLTEAFPARWNNERRPTDLSHPGPVFLPGLTSLSLFIFLVFFFFFDDDCYSSPVLQEVGKIRVTNGISRVSSMEKSDPSINP